MPSSKVQRIGLQKIALVLFMSASLWLALISVVSAESITSFKSNIFIQEDSSLLVTESIAYDFGWTYRHGMYRIISDKHAQAASVWYKKRYVDIEVLSVLRDGQEEPYQVKEDNGVFLQIGDPNSTVAGKQEYKITYRVEGALSEYPEGFELYWNATGGEWDTTIENASVEIHLSNPVSFVSRQECYTGSTGDVKSCDDKQLLSDKAIFTQDKLRPGQELTIAQGINLPNPPVVLERVDGILFWFLLLVAWFAGLGVWLYRWYFQHRISQSVIAQYEPYADFKPMFTGVLFDNKLDSRDISASIVYLAQQGFISIKQTKDKVLWLFETTDYEITLLRADSEVETELQKQVLSLLFRYAGKSGTVVRLSELTKNQSKRVYNYKTIKEMKKAAVSDLVERGFLDQKINRAYRAGIPAFIFLAFYISVNYGIHTELLDEHLIVIVITAFVSLAVVVLFGGERRTKHGYEALNHLKGFKDFLSTTEKERYKFHNAPSLSPQQFMEYLPYSIAFGVEDEWAKVFKDIQIDAPDWYSSDVSGSHFNAAHLTGDLGSFASTFSGSTGSSRSSGFGSGGGGFSGGGGGGGGGGSW